VFCDTFQNSTNTTQHNTNSFSGSGNITRKIIVYFLITPELVQIIFKTINSTELTFIMWRQAIPYINYHSNERVFSYILFRKVLN